jgi:putative tryptophan/tyrosine transport system substrate-binding protein
MQFGQLRRREFITLLGGVAATRPFAADAQQPAMMGFLSPGSLEPTRERVAAMQRGLADAGYLEGRNLTVEYRWAGDRYDLLPEMAADLVRRQVGVVHANSVSSVRAIRAITQTIPIVFTIGTDPVEEGFVASLNRPGGNVTGVTVLSADLVAKRLEILHELAPAATTIALLVNPSGAIYQSDIKASQAAAHVLGVRLLVIDANQPGDITAAFAALIDQRASALLVSGEAFFTDARAQIVALAARNRVPAIYHVREFAMAGGLVSYGPSLPDAWRHAGFYAGRILKGEKPADLPVQRSTKVELVLNLKVAKALGITFPLSLLGRADEVIE